MHSFVTEIDLKLTEPLRQGLKEQGFVFSQPAHTLFQARKTGITCTLYLSGKLVVQGKDKGPFIEFYLEPEILKSFHFNYTDERLDLSARIGVDESGKGDFFGPLCVAGVYADSSSIPELIKLGVRDSKKLQDTTILKIAVKIRKEYAHHIICIGPKRYNELYTQFGNLNLLLGWGHATVIEALIEKTGCKKALIDQFAAEHVVLRALHKKNQHVDLTQRTKGEEDIVVAAASILARASFVEKLNELSREIEITLPKGASQQTITIGKKLVALYGPEVLTKYGKLHFKTAQAILC